MPFTDLRAGKPAGRWLIDLLRAAGVGVPLWLGACSTQPPVDARPPAAPVAPKAPDAPAAAVGLPPPLVARNWAEFKLQAARRMVAASPDESYTGPVVEPLLAVPVLEVELNADGTIRRVSVLRVPKAGHVETVQMAIAAVHRAAPFGDVSRLPKPWLFTESFLYDDTRRFKPRTLNE